MPATLITGIGAATPLGCSYKHIADNLLAGHSGIRRITRFPVEDHPSQIGGQVDHIPCPGVTDTEEFGRLAPLDRLVRWCAVSALQDAGIWAERSDLRVGLVLGSATDWNTYWESDYHHGGRAIFEPSNGRESIAARTRRQLDLTGPALNLSAACASGNFAFGLAQRWLDLDWADVCLVGGADMAVTPIALAGFGNLRALSRRNADPSTASRPFDKDRDGFVLSEGGALFVFEKEARARMRGAHVYAEMVGCGAASDAFHMVIPNADPTRAIQSMRHALARGRLDPRDVNYVNAHATGTPVGDSAEARVLQAVFGDDVKRVPVSSTKSMTGHMVTAAAAVEAIACIVALERQAIAPTINLDNPDPECPLCHIPNETQERPVKVTASNSFGFGGSNTCLVLRAA